MTTTKTRATNRFLTEVGKYVKAHGGDAVVAGPVGLIHDDEFKFRVVVSVVGTPPMKK